MPASDRDKIQADLQTLEQKLWATGAGQEEIALKKANYFLNYKIKQKIDKNQALNPWSDVLQSLYEVENPSLSFVKQRQAYVADFCTKQPEVRSQKPEVRSQKFWTLNTCWLLTCLLGVFGSANLSAAQASKTKASSLQ